MSNNYTCLEHENYKIGCYACHLVFAYNVAATNLEKGIKDGLGILPNPKGLTV